MKNKHNNNNNKQTKQQQQQKMSWSWKNVIYFLTQLDVGELVLLTIFGNNAQNATCCAGLHTVIALGYFCFRRKSFRNQEAQDIDDGGT